MIQSKVILEKEEYRFVERGIIELNGKPDYRLQKKDYYTKRWNDIYLFDNQMQCLTAMEDHQYARWLDPDRVPCYVKDYDDESYDYVLKQLRVKAEFTTTALYLKSLRCIAESLVSKADQSGRFEALQLV